MQQYVVRRLLLAVPTLLVLSVVIFVMLRIVPGDPVDVYVTIAQVGRVDDEEREKIRKKLGLGPAHLDPIRGLAEGCLHGRLRPVPPIPDSSLGHHQGPHTRLDPGGPHGADCCRPRRHPSGGHQRHDPRRLAGPGSEIHQLAGPLHALVSGWRFSS